MGEYSHSKLSSYENCPRQFEYRYIQRLPRETESIEAFLGKRVHEILERLYHHVGRHGRPPSLRQVLERFEKDWALRWHPGIEIIRPEGDTEGYLQHGRRCLENYYRAHYPFDQGETVAIEQPVRMKLDNEGGYRIRGIIDRVVRSADGVYEIHDYKTSGRLPPQERLERDRQLALYQIGVLQTYPDAEEVELIWHYMVFKRTLRSRRSAAQLDEVRAATIRLIDEIEAASEYPTRTGPLCRWCEYRDVCPEGATRAESLASTEPPAPSPPTTSMEETAVPQLGPAGSPAGELASQLQLL